MQKKGNAGFQHLGICHRLFNFIMNSLIGRLLKRVTVGHPMPQDSTNQGPVDEYAMNEEQEPLTSHAEPTGEEMVDSEQKDDGSDSIVKIHFKQTEELDYWTPVDKLGSSVQPTEKDDKAMEKKIPVLNGISVDTTEPQVQGKIEVQPDASKPMLTGLGLNINEISETFIQNRKEKMMEPEET